MYIKVLKAIVRNNQVLKTEFFKQYYKSLDILIPSVILEVDSNQAAMSLPLVASAVFLIAR
jgi:hypothetical protein